MSRKRSVKPGQSVRSTPSNDRKTRTAVSVASKKAPAKTKLSNGAMPWKTAGWLVLAACVGTLIGIGAWGEDRLPYLAALLPFAIGITGSRTQAIFLGVSYILATERGHPAFAAAWFDGNMVVGVLLWFLSGLAGGLAWSLGWTASTKPWRKAAASVVAWIVTLVPPIALTSMGHPMVAWGHILPNTGWWGVFASVAVPAALLWMYALTLGPSSVLPLVAMPLAGVFLWGGIFAYNAYAYSPVEYRSLGNIAAMSTNWGAASNTREIGRRITQIGKHNASLAQNSDLRVLIYPEAIIQRYDPAMLAALKEQVIDPAAKAAQTVILGVDLPRDGGNWDTALMAFYPNGEVAKAFARQTIPLALWRPWQSTDSFSSDWRANNILKLEDGLRARVIFCYEEYLPLLGLINEAKDDFEIVVVVANTWAAKDPLAPAIQAQHSEGIAKLFGRPVMRAENRPKSPSR